jgi:hypothetical protein
MTLCAIFLAVIGIGLTFLPDELSVYINVAPDKNFVLILQLLGALYFGFGMLNWMAKGSSIGGIYNKPIVAANFAHFLIGALALLKGLSNSQDSIYFMWILAGIYSIFAILFGILFFRNPVMRNNNR